MTKRSVAVPAAALFALLLYVPPAHAQSRAPRFGAIFGAGLSGAPLGEIAERHGTRAVPGRDYEARVFHGSPQHEWSVGGIWDEYQFHQTIDLNTESRFEYTSASLVLGYSTLMPTGGVPTTFGIDLGVTEFRASSATPSYYTGEPESSRTRGHAILLNLSYGVEIPLKRMSMVPRLRLSTSYPDFGGGDGYSALHRESDLGFKASFGVNVRAVAPWQRK